MKRAFLSLLASALPCLAADRILELRASTNAPAVYQVPEGKCATVLGRGFERDLSTAWASVVRQIDRTNYVSFDEIGNTVQGPATVTLFVNRFQRVTQWLLLREWEPVPALPDTAPVLPAGVGAVLTLETSSDLSSWTPSVSTNLPAVATNRFFRLRLDLRPSDPGR